MEAGATRYTAKRQCFACHHQALSVSASRLAERRGFAVRKGFVAEQTAFTLDSFKRKLERVRKGEAVPGGNTMAAYSLFTLGEAGHAADETTAALVEYLLREAGGGRLVAGGHAAAAERGQPVHDRRPGADGPGAIRRSGTRVASAREKGLAWLRKAKPADHEDRVFRLMALSDAEGRDDLAARQNADGSWSQLEKLGGDAYATATALVALRRAGLDGERIERGVAYLLRTQRPGGEWLVTTRSRPVQTFFDNGDPGGKSQFISFLATGWAVRALLEAAP